MFKPQVLYMSRTQWNQIRELMGLPPWCEACEGTGLIPGGYDDCGREAQAVCSHDRKEIDEELRAQEDARWQVKLEEIRRRDRASVEAGEDAHPGSPG